MQRDEFVEGRSTVRRAMSMAITDTAQAPVSLRPPLACVAQPAVLQGEKTADFETLLAGISSVPSDIFEEIWNWPTWSGEAEIAERSQ